jgi:hypothetical protein
MSGDAIIDVYVMARLYICARWIAVWICLLTVGAVGGGCVSEGARRTPEYPVFWQSDRDCGAGFYLYLTAGAPAEDFGTGLKVGMVERRKFRLLIRNHTGSTIFLARYGDHVYNGMKYRVSFEKGESQSGMAFPFTGGCGGAFDRLVSEPFVAGDMGAEAFVEVVLSVPWRSGSGKAYVELAFCLNYYAQGADLPAIVKVTKTLQIE